MQTSENHVPNHVIQFQAVSSSFYEIIMPNLGYRNEIVGSRGFMTLVVNASNSNLKLSVLSKYAISGYFSIARLHRAEL